MTHPVTKYPNGFTDQGNMAGRNTVATLLNKITKTRSLRGTSLIVTVFGDSVSPHGGSIWLGSLIKTLAPLGINERLVRTSVFRLVQDGWLSIQKIGRRSYYNFTDYGYVQFERAADRIYRAGREAWDKQWTLLLLSTIPADHREELRKVLLWQGFGQLAPDLFARPSSDTQSLNDALRDMGLQEDVIVLRSATQQATSEQALKVLIQRKWELAALDNEYRRFLLIFKPVLEFLEKQEQRIPEACFQLRTLLIHEYRRILLKDVDLPLELLPPGWPGASAQNLTAKLYRKLGPAAEKYIEQNMESVDGYLPQANHAYYSRFKVI